MINTVLRHPLLKSIFTLAFFFFCSATYAGSILLWPIDPVIEDDQHGTMIWLENKDSEPAYLQIRVLSWEQANNEDIYERQNDVTVSPPFVLIPPGKRQLVRLIKNVNVSANTEKAYRILVDESPRANSNNNASNDNSTVNIGVKFQMRYSIPLFVSGAGVWTNVDYKKNRDIKNATMPKLSYRLNNQQGQTFLQVKNEGVVHARISKLSGQSGKVLVDGLVGYVLPGSTMNLPLPRGNNYNSAGKLQAMINNNPEPVSLIVH